MCSIPLNRAMISTPKHAGSTALISRIAARSTAAGIAGRPNIPIPPALHAARARGAVAMNAMPALMNGTFSPYCSVMRVFNMNSSSTDRIARREHHGGSTVPLPGLKTTSGRRPRARGCVASGLSSFESSRKLLVVRGATQVDDNFSLRVAISEGVVGALDGSEGEAPLVNQWNELASFDELGRLCENIAMVSATLAGKKRQQRENAGIRGALEGQGSKPVAAPSEAAHHVAEAAHRLERRVERSTARSIVDDVEPASAGQTRDIVCDGLRAIDEVCAKAFNDGPARWRARRKDPGSKGPSDLDCHVADTTGSSVHQDRLARLQAGAVDQPLPRGDEYKRQRSRLAHRDIRRFGREQIGIDGREFRKRTLLATDTPGHSVNFVTTTEALNALARRLDGPGEIEAENGGQRMARVRGGASADLDVERIDGTCGDTHQRLAGSRDGTRNR